MEKYRSIDPEYIHQILKEYTYWTLSLNADQHYLGRAYVWLVRPGGMQRFSEITDDEMTELRVVIREYEAAIAKLWQPDFMNYAWLANLFDAHGGHGHLHLIPRYKAPRTFEGTEFVDGRWGKNYTPSEEFIPPAELFQKIQSALKGALA